MSPRLCPKEKVSRGGREKNRINISRGKMGEKRLIVTETLLLGESLDFSKKKNYPGRPQHAHSSYLEYRL